MPGFLPAEDRQCGGDTVQDAAQIDVDHVVPCVDVQVLQWGDRPDAGVVDQHVEAPESGDRRVDQADEVRTPPYVGRHADGAAAALPDLGGELLDAIAAPGAEDDRRTAPRQGERGGSACPAARTGDGDDLVAGSAWSESMAVAVSVVMRAAVVVVGAVVAGVVVVGMSAATAGPTR